MDSLSFTLSLEEVPVNITDKEGVTKTYVIREMTGKLRDQYIGFLNKNGPADPATGMRRYVNNELAYLVSLCLFDPDNKPVPLSEIADFPNRVQQGLAAKCQELCVLTPEAVEAKKD